MYYKKMHRLCVAALLLPLLIGCHQNKSVAQQDQKRNEHIAASLQTAGALSKDEYFRIVRLDADVSSGKALSEADADWLLYLTDRPGTPYQKGIRLLHTSTVFKHGKVDQFPASRRQKIFDMAVQMLPYKSDVVTTAVPFSGCMILGVLGDLKGVPFLQKMLNSPYPEVRDSAKHSIKHIKEIAK